MSWSRRRRRVAASPAEVGLVLDNLLGNALRHARSVVRVAVLPAGRWVRLVVEDDGPGIPEADRRRVFDRFTRLDPEAAAGGGAGLGLALVAALVHGPGRDGDGGRAAGGAPAWRSAGPPPAPTPAAPRRARRLRDGRGPGTIDVRACRLRDPSGRRRRSSE